MRPTLLLRRNWLALALPIFLFVFASTPAQAQQPTGETTLVTVELSQPAQEAQTLPGSDLRINQVSAFEASTRLVTVQARRGVDVSVLVLSPDQEPPTNLVTDLNAFSEITATMFPASSLPSLSLGDLEDYDVVMTNNNNQWAANAVLVGNVLADYVDEGGKVVLFSYVYDNVGWELGGRFMAEDYGPFDFATGETGADASMDIVEPDHPVMAGVSSLTTDGLRLILPVQASAQLLANWSDGTPFIAVNNNVVGMNVLYGAAITWAGDLAVLARNAALWLAEGEDAMSIADARALGAGETVTVEGVVTRAMGAFTYFQDDTAGLSIRQVSGGFYDDVADGTIGTGTRVRVTGELSEFRGLMQINDGDLDDYEILGEEDEPEPHVITLEDLVDDAYQAELVHIENLSFIDAEGTFAEATSYDVTDATVDPATVELRVPNASDTNIIGEDIPDGEFTFTGVVGSFDEPQLMAINATDVSPGVSTEVGGEVASFSLGSAYPNPVRGTARITFEVPQAEHVLIEVFDLLGQRVATLVDGQLEAAQHEVSWDAGSLANGMYLYRMQAGSFSQTLRVTVLN